jgi:hypothetical protein
MQLAGENERLASMLLRRALMKHGGAKAVQDGEMSDKYVFAHTFLKSASRKDSPSQLVYKASKLAKEIIRKEGLSVLKEDDMDGLWEEITDDKRKEMDPSKLMRYGSDPETDGSSEEDMDDYYARYEDEVADRQRYESPSIEEMLKDEYIDV